MPGAPPRSLTKSPMALAREALAVGQRVLPPRSSKSSRKGYTQAQLYAVLAVNSGCDSTTMASLYPDINVYTTRLVTQFAKPGKRTGKWVARPTKDTRIRLDFADDGSSPWPVGSKDNVQRLARNWLLTDDLLTLAQSEQGGALVGRAAWQTGDR